MQGGKDRSWARPFNPNPNPQEAYGTHRGSMECLNILNRQPGYHYFYGHRAMAHRGFVHRMARYGAVAVKQTDPEQYGGAMPESFGLPQDSLFSSGDVFLMRMPIERYRKYLQDEAATRESSRARPTEALLEQEGNFMASYKNAPHGGVVFAMPDHGRTGYKTEEV